MEQSWVELLKNFGWPTLLLFAVAYIAYRRVVPYLEERRKEARADRAKYEATLQAQIEAANRERIEATTEFTELIKGTLYEHTTALRNVGDQMKALTEEVRSKRG